MHDFKNLKLKVGGILELFDKLPKIFSLKVYSRQDVRIFNSLKLFLVNSRRELGLSFDQTQHESCIGSHGLYSVLRKVIVSGR